MVTRMSSHFFLFLFDSCIKNSSALLVSSLSSLPVGDALVAMRDDPMVREMVFAARPAQRYLSSAIIRPPFGPDHFIISLYMVDSCASREPETPKFKLANEKAPAIVIAGLDMQV